MKHDKYSALDYAVARDVEPQRIHPRKLARMGAKMVGGESAREIIDHLDGRHPLESEAEQIFLAAAAERIEPPRASRMRRLARGLDQRSTDPAPAHRLGHGERAYHRGVHDRLDSGDAGDRVVHRRGNPACTGRIEAARDDSSRFAGRRKYRFDGGEVAGLRDVEFARRAAASRGYFLGGGNSCVPVSSSITTIALAGHARAAAMIAPSDAPAGL